MSNTFYKRREQLIAATMGEETVMMDIVSGKYYSLGITGGAIWNILEKPADLDTIVEELIQEFDVDCEICKAQVADFLKAAVQKEIIQIV